MPTRLSRIVAAGSFALLISCADEGRDGPGRAADAPAPMRHAVHSENLRQVMDRMGGDVRKTWPQEIEGLKAEEARRDERVRFQDASRLAGSLAEAAGMIPQAIVGSDLSDEDREAFVRGVNKLHAQAGELRARADARDRQGMETTLAQIKTTCMNCHVQFRELAGPLRFGY